MARHVTLLAGLMLGCTSVGSSTPCAAGMEPFPTGTVVLDPRCPGACDPIAARAVVYDAEGRAAYAGQAVVFNSCAAGACHSRGVSSESRQGAPAGLDFVLDPIASADESPILAELAADRQVVLDQVDDIWGSVVGGSMPPGEIGAAQEQAAYRWSGVDGPVLARLSTAEGREILRNWLACGAPYVDRTDTTGDLTACPAGATCGGDYVASAPAP